MGITLVAHMSNEATCIISHERGGLIPSSLVQIALCSQDT